MTISPQSRKTFEKFVKQAEKVLNSKLIQSGFSLEANFSFKEGGHSITTTSFDGEQVKALVSDLRPMLLEEETIFINKIFNLIEIGKPKKEILEMAREIRSIHVNSQQQSTILINHAGEEYNDEKMFKTILYAEYAHLDDDKIELIGQLGDLGQTLARHQLMNYIYNVVIAIANLRNAVTLILEEENRADPTVLELNSSRLASSNFSTLK